MLVLVTLGYYGLLFFLNKKRKAAFEKNAVTVLGDTTNLEVNEAATETDLFGKVNNNVNTDRLSELTTLLDTDHELVSNMTNMIDDIEVEVPTAPAPSSIIPQIKKSKVETVGLINLVTQEKNSTVFPIQKTDLIQALEGLDNQDDRIDESDIDVLMSQMISKQ